MTIFMEYVPGGSVRLMLDRFGVFGDRIVKIYTVQLMQGLYILHKEGIAHRDIKVTDPPPPSPLFSMPRNYIAASRPWAKEGSRERILDSMGQCFSCTLFLT